MYLVGRAAAFELRAPAVMLKYGVYDFDTAFRKKTPALGKFFIRTGWDGNMNAIMRLLMSLNTSFKWGISNGKWVFRCPAYRGGVHA